MNKGKPIFYWTRAHCGMDRNEQADEIVKQAEHFGPVLPCELTLNKCKIAASNRVPKDWFKH